MRTETYDEAFGRDSLRWEPTGALPESPEKAAEFGLVRLDETEAVLPARPEGIDLPHVGCLGEREVGSAVFAAAATTEEQVRCRIAHKDRTLAATGLEWYVQPGTWLTTFYLAVVCREKDRITALCRVPMRLFRENGSRLEEYRYPWIDTLQTYWLGGPELVPKLVGRGRRHGPGGRRRPGDGGQADVPADGDVPSVHPQEQRRLQPCARCRPRMAQGILDRGESGIPGLGLRRACAARHGLLRPRWSTYGGFKSRRFSIGTFEEEDFFFEATNRSDP